MLCQQHLLPFSMVSFWRPQPPLKAPVPLSLPPRFNFLHKPTSLHCVSPLPRPYSPEPCLAQMPETTSAAPETTDGDGPIELPPSEPSIFAATDDPSPLQVSASVLLTGVISVFLFRAVRRRIRRAKEMRFRSSGTKKTLKEEALESLKVIAPASLEAPSPRSPIQPFLGGIIAGVIALILYKFAVTVGESLSRQTMSDNFSVRQLTVTIRTVINGVCYLSTFVFGVNSIGLLLYSGQLTVNALMGGSSSNDQPPTLSNPVDSSSNGRESKSLEESQNSDDTQE